MVAKKMTGTNTDVFARISEQNELRFPRGAKVKLIEDDPTDENHTYELGVVQSYISGCEDNPDGAYISVDFERADGGKENLWVTPDEIMIA